ncbi:hypothetical protein BVC80_9101g176 [Macleaya cordata]|uniref:Histone chaperone domain CHZ n=1 Tax=Macleaya cordata TaxID=56857 RepID=A0A200QGM1_MACCD|nr:hypothetical protein BVC80_9101g176 [Macleaya cordata]
MADLKNNALEDPSLPSKRNPDLECLNQDIDRKKKKTSDLPVQEVILNNKEDEITKAENKDDEDEDEDGVNEVLSNGKSVIDRKGKGIMREDKGKGKLMVEEEGINDDDSSDYVVDCSDEDSDLSNDPLAEVDLDNILPSRTRRLVTQPGAYLVNDMDNDEDSDDSDA